MPPDFDHIAALLDGERVVILLSLGDRLGELDARRLGKEDGHHAGNQRAHAEGQERDVAETGALQR